MRISDWSSDVCSSDLRTARLCRAHRGRCGKARDQPAEPALSPSGARLAETAAVARQHHGAVDRQGAGVMELLFLAHRVPYPPDRGDKIRSFHLLKHLAARATVHLVDRKSTRLNSSH